MKRIKPPILGEAIFATMDGLTIFGTGCLEATKVQSDALEFAVGRGRGEALHGLAGDPVAFFRRSCIGADGRAVELLGHIAPCVDYAGRRGYFGAAIAIPADQTRSGVAIHDWTSVALLTEERLQRLSKRLDEKARVIDLPKTLIPEKRPIPSGPKLAPADRTEARLYCETDDMPPSEILALVQAAAFIEGSRIATILLFGERVDNATALASQDMRERLEQFEARVRDASQPPRREERSLVPSQRKRADFDQEASPSPSHRARKNQPDGDGLLERLAQLERRVSELERGGGGSQYFGRTDDFGHAAGARPAPKAASFAAPAPDNDLEMWKMIAWVSGIAILFILLVGLLWIVLRPIFGV